jgi:ribosomal protein S27AE
VNRRGLLKGLPAMLTLRSVVDFGSLVPNPAVRDCPNCKRGKLIGANGHRYCQRCGHTQESK